MTLPDRPPVYLKEPPRPAPDRPVDEDADRDFQPANGPAPMPSAHRSKGQGGGWFLPAAVLVAGLGFAVWFGNALPIVIGIIVFGLLHDRNNR